MDIESYIPPKGAKQIREERIQFTKKLEQKAHQLDQELNSSGKLPNIPYYRLVSNLYRNENMANEYAFVVLKHYYNAIKEFKNTHLQTYRNVEKDVEKSDLYICAIKDAFTLALEYHDKIENACSGITKLCDKSTDEHDEITLINMISINNIIKYILVLREGLKSFTDKVINPTVFEINQYLEDIKLRFGFTYKI